jgi:DNA damage-inducible protein 1
VPQREQQLQFAGNNLNDLQTLRQAGVNNDDMITMVRRKREDVSELASSLMSALGNIPRAQPTRPAQRFDPTPVIVPFTKPSSNTPDAWLEQAKAFATAAVSNHHLMGFFSAQYPMVADAIHKSQYRILVQFLQRVAENQEEKRLEQLALTNPDHPDVQKHIEEQIRRKAIDEQHDYAMEHNPESFASIIMLYCKVFVNGNQISALIDSGAQMTIMSKTCAERCGILRFLDTRFASVARGVGESKILGKIHAANLKIGNVHIDVAIHVIEQNTLEFIFGLDMMRKHRAVIDLRQDCLLLGDEKVPFMTEGEMPDRIRGSNGIKTSSEIARDMIEKAEESERAARAQSNAMDVSRPSESSAPQAQADPTKVKELAEMMGVSEAAAAQALTVSNGNMDAAASFLLSSSR